MRIQILLSMLFMLAMAIAFVLLIAAVFLGVSKAYSSAQNPINSSYATLGNVLIGDAQPYSEFHMIITNS